MITRTRSFFREKATLRRLPTTIAPLPPVGSVAHTKANYGGSIPTIASYLGLSDLTIELWVKITDTNLYGRIMDCNYITGIAIACQGSNNFSFTGLNAWGDFSSTSGTLPLNTWKHIAGVRQGSNFKIYVNGVVDVSTSCATNAFSAQNPWYIAGGQAELSAGLSSDLRFWNYARSAAEISANFSTRLSGAESGLLMYYKFNEPSGVFADATGNNVPMTHNGTTSYSTDGPPIS